MPVSAADEKHDSPKSKQLTEQKLCWYESLEKDGKITADVQVKKGVRQGRTLSSFNSHIKNVQI